MFGTMGRGNWEGSIHALPFRLSGVDGEGDEELVEALRRGHPGAALAFFDRYAEGVDRLLGRILGDGDGRSGLIEMVFVNALQHLGDLRPSVRLGTFLNVHAVRVARRILNRDRRSLFWRRLLRTTAITHPKLRESGGDEDAVLRATYHLLDGLPVDWRIVFCLRVFDEMPLVQVADTCEISLTRTRRTLRRAQSAFLVSSEKLTPLRRFVYGGLGWKLPSPG